MPNPDDSGLSTRPPNSCARLSDERATWFRAKALCVAEDANLIEVNSPTENRFISVLEEVARAQNRGAEGKRSL